MATQFEEVWIHKKERYPCPSILKGKKVSILQKAKKKGHKRPISIPQPSPLLSNLEISGP
jgi:hypothetical protein